MVSMMRLVLDYVMPGGSRRRGGNWILGLPPVEVTVTAAGGAFERSGISGIGGGGRHELAAAIDGVPA